MARAEVTYGKPLARFVELALSVVVASALCYTMQGGFNVSDAIHEAVWLDVLVCVVLQGILLAGQYAPQGRVASLVGYAVVSLGACVVAIAVAPAGNPIADVPQNLFVATALFAVVNLLVFALARRRMTCIILLGLGAFICGCTQFLYTTNMLVATVVFVVGAGMLVAFRSYAETVELVSATSWPLLGKATAVGVLIPFAACALASIVAIGLIMPLDPPHASIKLFNEYLSYEEDPVKTAVNLDEHAEKKLTSSTIDENLEPRTTTDLKIDESAPLQANPDDGQHDTAKDYLSGDYSDIDLTGLIDNMRSIALDAPFPWWLIVLLVIVLLVTLLALPRYLVHRIRLSRIASRSPGEQVALFYQFFLGRFARLGVEKPASLTPVEYANLFRDRLAPFAGAQEAGSFDHLTALYVQQEYAGIAPDSDDVQCMHWMYRTFYRRCRKELGLFKYAFKHMTL